MCCHGRPADDPCCCHSGREAVFVRRFQTKQERIDELQQYLRQLKAEIQAVEEQLADLNR